MKPQILVVDDEPLLLPVIATVLRRAGYGVWQATSPKEALQMAAHGLPPMALLLADVFMPKLTGPQLSEHLLEYFPDMKTLFMTGLNTEYLRAIGIEVPIDKLLSKPFSNSALLAMVVNALDMPLGEDSLFAEPPSEQFRVLPSPGLGEPAL